MENIANNRSFEHPEGVTYYIVPPTAEDISGADWQYSKTYTKCLVEGITTAAEMRDILTRRGIIGPEFEQRAQELTEDLALKLNDLEEATEVDTKRDGAIAVAMARDALYQWNQRLNGPISNTCENISDESRIDFLTAAMIRNADGNKVWDNYTSYLKDKSQDLANKARFEVMLYLQGLSSDFLDNTPEAVAMREVENEVLTKAQEALEALAAAEKELEDREEADVKATAKKKKTSKKATK